jgi:RNA polymerase sigma-70 factor
VEPGNSNRRTSIDAVFRERFAACAAALEETYARCVERHPAFEVSLAEFRDAVASAARKYLVREAGPVTCPTTTEIGPFISELHVEDLYLVLACNRGDERAWWEFDREHRSFIERCVRNLMTVNGAADEIIETVYVELFGTRVVDGVRRSKLTSYTGRGTLRGWLRTVILNAVVDSSRAPKFEIAMDDLSASHIGAPQRTSEVENSIVTKLVTERYQAATKSALDSALSALDDHETLLLLYYHVEGLKLREIARIVDEPASPIRRWFQRRGSRKTRVHESTVMRWLEKVYRKVSDRFHSELAGKHGLKPEEIEICKSIAAEDPPQKIELTDFSGRLKEKRGVVEGASR